MTYLTIPTPTRALADTVAAEMSTVRQAFPTTLATPAALERAEPAAERTLDQLKPPPFVDPQTTVRKPTNAPNRSTPGLTMT